jgi:hypothetical protein
MRRKKKEPESSEVWTVINFGKVQIRVRDYLQIYAGETCTLKGGPCCVAGCMEMCRGLHDPGVTFMVGLTNRSPL